MSKAELVKLQNKRLKNLIHYVYQGSHYFRRRLNAAGISPDDIGSREDLKKVPFTTKTDLRDNYPLGMISVDRSKLVRLHVSSGTTGNPTVVAYTRKDIENWAEMNARCLEITGVTSQDVVQVAYGYGLFTGGLGLHYGAERLGTTGKHRKY
ncbi:MAG: hypothetical protein LUQ00_00260 [Candidatus Methanomethyliaceae archaeon]|nr:hypothetical protein [Candidatus Methanomethyliaceae archaeon]